VRIEYANRAERDLRRLDRRAAERVRAALDRFVETGAGDVVPLAGQPGRYRPRVGGYRILFHRPEPGVVRVERVAPRGDVYQPLARIRAARKVGEILVTARSPFLTGFSPTHSHAL
jgi:mRNA-degrading endonuclease RelE of RelBE toxin-antitoxin system